jgi:hypothetical protein
MLENADVQMITPDLPSYRTLTAGLAEDAAEVHHPCEPALRQWPLSAGPSGVGVQPDRDYLAVHGPIMRPSGSAASPRP